MKNIKLSVATFMTIGTLAYAGGDIAPLTYYETADFKTAEQIYVEAPKVEEVYEAPAPIVVEQPVVNVPVSAPTKVVESAPLKNIKANGFYAGMGISGAYYNTNCKSDCKGSGNDITFGVMGRLGYDFNKYLGIEARLLKTSLNSDGGKVNHGGVFLKPMYPISDTTNIYGLVGLAKTKTDGDLQTTEAEALALGAGVEIDLSEDKAKEGRYNRVFDGHGDQEKGLGVFLDYERMVVKSGAPDLDAVSAGLTYDF